MRLELNFMLTFSSSFFSKNVMSEFSHEKTYFCMKQTIHISYGVRCLYGLYFCVDWLGIFFGHADVFVGWFASVTKSQLATSERFCIEIKAFYLEIVGSKDEVPHKKHGVLLLDSHARPYWKNTSKKTSSSWGNLIPQCSVVSWPFLMLSRVLVSLFRTNKMTRVGLIPCFSVLLLFSENIIEKSVK